ncbi:MAG: GNAT family N-acetyltransferase [Actinomycetota bacterium]
MRKIRLTSGDVVLRAFKTSELDGLLGFYRQGRGPVVVGGISRAQVRRRVDGSGIMKPGWITFAIEAEGRLVGEIQARAFPKTMSPPGVFEIGISIFDETKRGRGLGSNVVALFTDWLLTEGGASRVQASTAVTNRAMRRVLEKTGYEKEGILRGFMPGPNGREDSVLYARTSLK